MELFTKNYRNLFKSTGLLSSIYRRHVSRALTGDRLTPLTQDTLTGRILSYLHELIDKKDDIITENTPQFISDNHVSHALLLLNTLRNLNTVKNRYELKKSIKTIDKECCERSCGFNIKDSLSLLWSFTNTIPHRVTDCQYFHLALRQLIQSLDVMTKTELIQLIFFIGFLKKSSEAQKMMRTCLKKLDKSILDSLTKEELCIVCNASFKTATKINNKSVLNKIKSYINQHLDILNDPQMFITFLKSIRHNRFQDDDLLETVTCTIFFNNTVKCYNFPAICHILALYSDYLYYDTKIIKLLVEEGINQLKDCAYHAKDTYLDTQPRAKDIKRFLWALSNLNHLLSKKDIEEVILPQVKIRIDAGEFRKDSGTLIEIILYLWIMNYRASELIQIGLAKEDAAYIKAHQIATVDKLNFLLTCIYFEDRELFDTLELYPEAQTIYNMNHQKEKRPHLIEVLEILKKLNHPSSIKKFELSCQVPCVNIIGIIGVDDRNTRVVNIEILDSYTLTKNNTDNMTGLMALKMRILGKYDEGLIIMDADDLEDLDDQEIQEMLQEDLDLIC